MLLGIPFYVAIGLIAFPVIAGIIMEFFSKNKNNKIIIQCISLLMLITLASLDFSIKEEENSKSRRSQNSMAKNVASNLGMSSEIITNNAQMKSDLESSRNREVVLQETVRNLRAEVVRSFEDNRVAQSKVINLTGQIIALRAQAKNQGNIQIKHNIDLQSEIKKQNEDELHNARVKHCLETFTPPYYENFRTESGGGSILRGGDQAPTDEKLLGNGRCARGLYISDK